MTPESNELNLILLIRFFDAANKGKRKLVITFADFRLTQTKSGNYPGCVYICPVGEDGWYGRIHLDGKVEWIRGGVVPNGLVEKLIAFANNPQEFAAKHGRTTGRCCFCHTLLTDDRNGSSVDVGYGPVCAAKWGLPHSGGKSKKKSRK